MRIVLFVASILIAFCGIVICYIVISTDTDYINDKKRDNAQSINQIPIEYKELINTKGHLLSETNTIYTATRNPISQFYLDNNYFIVIYKIGKIGIRNFIKEQYNKFDNPLGHFRAMNGAPEDHNKYFFCFRTGQSNFKNEVYLTLNAQSNHPVKEDNRIVYSLTFHKFSIRYSKSGDIDIYQKSEENVLMPTEIAFLKRNKNLYLIMLTTNNAQALDPKTLYKLII